MAGKRGQKAFASILRAGAQKAIEERYGSSGPTAAKMLWRDVLEQEGPAKMLELLSRYVPREVDLGDAANANFVIGALPSDAEWAERQGLPEPVSVTVEGEVLEQPALTNGKGH